MVHPVVKQTVIYLTPLWRCQTCLGYALGVAFSAFTVLATQLRWNTLNSAKHLLSATYFPRIHPGPKSDPYFETGKDASRERTSHTITSAQEWECPRLYHCLDLSYFKRAGKYLDAFAVCRHADAILKMAIFFNLKVVSGIVISGEFREHKSNRGCKTLTWDRKKYKEGAKALQTIKLALCVLQISSAQWVRSRKWECEWSRKFCRFRILLLVPPPLSFFRSFFLIHVHLSFFFCLLMTGG